LLVVYQYLHEGYIDKPKNISDPERASPRRGGDPAGPTPQTSILFKPALPQGQI